MVRLTIFGLALALASAPLAAQVQSQSQPAPASAVTYFKAPAGAFERSVTMTFQSLPRVGDEIRAGANIYRVVRVLHVIAGQASSEVRLYFEQVGPAEAD